MAEILNIDRWLQPDNAPKNRIERIGVELEGGWEHLPEGTNLEHDGSVTGFKALATGVQLRTGEIPSPPKIPAAMWPWVKKFYPQYVNNTCGMHLHMSFASAKLYQMLMVEDFQLTMIEYLKRWAEEEKLPKRTSTAAGTVRHPIWDRLEGKNVYCQFKFWPDKQAAQKRKSHNRDVEGHRYTAINYCFGLNDCQTVEVRILPMFDSYQQAIRALQRVMLITNASLLALAKREAKTEENFKLDRGMDAYIETTEEIIR